MERPSTVVGPRDGARGRRHDLFLSHAGEDAAYVTAVARALEDRAVSVYCSEFRQSDAWGRELGSYLREQVDRAERYFVLFGSRSYEAKMWTTYEHEAAVDRVLRGRSDFVLPVVLDDTTIPGVADDVVRLDGRVHTPEELAERLCDKLGEPVERRPRAYRWFDGLDGGTDRMRTFQSVPVGDPAGPLTTIARQCSRELVSRRREDGDGSVHWTQGEDRPFDRLYATSSVLYALRQIQLSADDRIVAGGEAFLGAAGVDSVDQRAAAFYRLVVDDLSTVEVVTLVNLLAEQQLREDSTWHGSFLFTQGPTPASTSNWKPQRHYGGAAFHACHVADTLLHMAPRHAGARLTTLTVLDGLRGFLERTLHGDGWLRDADGWRAPLTSYAYALLPRLSLPLPRGWRDNAQESFALAVDPARDALTTCLAPVNLGYIHATTGDDDLRVAARAPVIDLMTRLAEWDLTALTVVEVAMLLRAAISSARLLEPGLFAAVSVRAALDVRVAEDTR